MQEIYYVYIISCSDKSYYIGLTNDLIKRFEEHLDGKYPGCYTFDKRPLNLEYYETIPFINEAIDREKQLKGWSRSKKKALITSNFHKLQLLSQCQNMSHHKYYNLQKSFDDAQHNPSTSLRASPEGSRRTLRKIGILGGGQLGRMLLQAAANYPVETYVLENDNECPAAHLCHHFITGDIKNFDDVYNFGKGLDAITIEIESVNEEALEKLENEGIKVFPSPAALKIIKNKILQKQFYNEYEIPTAAFAITKNLNDIPSYPALFPAMHKIAMGGYDGRGVISIKNKEDFIKGFDEPAVLEKKIDISKEISIIAASNGSKITLYPAVEMVFNPALNLLDYQLSPAELPENDLWKLEAIAIKVVKNLNSPGIFAIEMFIDKENNIWVNETAPRVHNSGHHTIEANFSSQFDMLWRVMLGYPLGNTKHIMPAAIVNILGEERFNGEAIYEGLHEVLQLENVFVHIYGKKQTKPGRKMGHVTILGDERLQLVHTAHKIKQNLKVKGI